MLEYERFSGSFTEFGVQGHQCSKIHCDFIKEFKNTNILWYSTDLLQTKQKHNTSIPQQFAQSLDNLITKNDGTTVKLHTHIFVCVFLYLHFQNKKHKNTKYKNTKCKIKKRMTVYL